MKAGMVRTGEHQEEGLPCREGTSTDAAKSLEWNSDSKPEVVSEGAGTYRARDTVTSDVVNKAHNSRGRRFGTRITRLVVIQ